MIDDNKIEISFDLDIRAVVAREIDRSTWHNKTDEEKREIIGEMIDEAAKFVMADLFYLENRETGFRGSISASIDGPDDAEINLEDVTMYDPKA
jgi:hypothetical protein